MNRVMSYAYDISGDVLNIYLGIPKFIIYGLESYLGNNWVKLLPKQFLCFLLYYDINFVCPLENLVAYSKTNNSLWFSRKSLLCNKG